MKLPSTPAITKSRLLAFLLFLLYSVCSLIAPAADVFALSKEQQALYRKNILYYDLACDPGAGTDSPVEAGNGSPEGTLFPNLDPAAMASSIDKFIRKSNPNSRMKNLGQTIVAGAENSNINPFLIVSLAQKESSLADPRDYNVAHANNSFGRTATPTQPHHYSASVGRYWYKWTTVKASVDHTAPENRNAGGGGDIAAYLIEQYAEDLDKGDLESFMNAYAPPFENDTETYVRNIREWMKEMADSAREGSVPASGSANDPLAPEIKKVSVGGGSCACPGDGSVSLNGNNNAEKIWNFFLDEGFTPQQAAGFLGNFSVETGDTFDPMIVQGGGRSQQVPQDGLTGYGLAQWTSIDRQRGLAKLDDPHTLETQLSYVMKELKGGYASVLNAIKHTKTVDEATRIISYDYESPAVPDNPDRWTEAQKYFEMFSEGIIPGDGTMASSDPCAGSSGSAGEFSGSAQEAAKLLLSKEGIEIYDDAGLIQAIADGGDSPISEKLILLLAGLAQNHTFGISSLYRGPCSGSNHCTGNAADINPTIDGEAISYSGHNQKIQAFIDDAAKILGGNCENGVPNEQYVSQTKSNGSKCEVFVDIGTGPHVHLSVSAGT